jgi:Ca2+-binding RTX toxin-like protein
VAAGVGLALVITTAAPAQSPRVIVDDFSQDRLATNYVLHAGEPMVVDDGVLRSTGPQAPDEVMTHNASAGLVDSEVTLQVNFKDAVEHGTTAGVVKFLGPGTYLRLATTYTSSSIKVSKWENGVRTDLLVADGLYTLTPNTTYWVRGRIAGNAITVALWGNDPQQGGTPIALRNYTLRGANATKFGAGVAGRAGIYLDPFDTVREFDNLRITGTTAASGGGGGNPTPLPAPIPPPDDPSTPGAPGPCEVRTVGTAHADTLTGTGGSDYITALAGNDDVKARAGDDCVFGRRGGDRLRGGSGSDHLLGGRGADRIQGGRGRDAVFGGKGPDRIVVTGNGRDRVRCGRGEDVVYADLEDLVGRDCERWISAR